MTDDRTISLGAHDLAALTAEAKASARRRSHRNLHEDFAEPVQRLLIAAEPETYVQPHRHPALPWEMIVLIQGAMDVLLFDDDGRLHSRIALRPDGDRIIQYPGLRYHSALVRESGTVVMEIKNGPYDPAAAKDMAAWAPAEDTPDGPAFRDALDDLAVGAKAG